MDKIMATNLLNQELHLLNNDKSMPEIVDNQDLRLHKLEVEIAKFSKINAEKSELLLDRGTQYLNFQRFDEAWDSAKTAFDFFIAHQNWQSAVIACDIMVAADQPDSLKALAHGIWLGITYPINPETTVAILQHLIDESPVGSETAAVAAITAHYIADIRKSDDKAGESLTFFTHQILGKIAAEHRNIKSQEEFDIWMMGNEFDNPESFLPKLSAAVNALVDGKWWFNKDQLRAEIS